MVVGVQSVHLKLIKKKHITHPDTELKILHKPITNNQHLWNISEQIFILAAGRCERKLSSTFTSWWSIGRTEGVSSPDWGHSSSFGGMSFLPFRSCEVGIVVSHWKEDICGPF